MTTETTVIEQAVTEAGGAAKVAERFGINPVSVYEWITASRLPAKRVIALSEMSNWKFRPHDLDADLYPNPTDGLPL